MEINEDIREELKLGLSESVKLIKNTKGYNWEIRLLEINLDRLKTINDEMILKFGGSE